MKNTLKEFVRLSLDILTEEIFGKQAFLYHGTREEPYVFLDLIHNDTFKPGLGSGSMYGKGLYTVYKLDNTSTSAGSYGNYVYKLKVNLHGCISFEPEITKKIYGKSLNTIQQIDYLKINVSNDIRNKIIQLDEKISNETNEYSSRYALEFSKYCRGLVKGIIYNGAHDGECCVIYDPSIATIVAYKKYWEPEWTKFDENIVKKSLSKSRAGDFDLKKYESIPADDPKTSSNFRFLMKVIESGDFLSMHQIANNSYAPEKILRLLASKDKRFYESLVSNRATPNDVLEDIANVGDRTACMLLSKRFDLKDADKIIRSIYKRFSDDFDISAYLIMQPECPKEIVVYYATKFEDDVPERQQQKAIRSFALGNSKCDEEILNKVYKRLISQTKGSYEGIRFEIGSIVSNKNCPRNIFENLVVNLNEKNLSQCNILEHIANSQSVPEHVLKYMAQNCKNTNILSNIASNENSNEDILESVFENVKFSDTYVFSKLFNNKNITKNLLIKMKNYPGIREEYVTLIKDRLVSMNEKS